MLMLPESRFKGAYGDAEYITMQLARLPVTWRSGAAAKYSAVYQEEGRAAANNRLREYADRFNNKGK